ncbi:chaperonin 10-like protein [Ochromonadaceae sp. CCMP2298]|nr:chaperonin 10-like protein [Ochromonadaceae sp. CCMP2298]
MKQQLLSHPRPKYPLVWSENVSPELVMRAVYYDQHGGEEVMQETAYMIRPKPSKGQVQVRVAASSVNPVDIKLRENALSTALLPLPKIPGSDICGVVVNSQSDLFREGDRVFGSMPLLQSWGGAAEYASIDATLLALVPPHLSDVQAASLPLVGQTVIQALRSFVDFYAHDTAGRRVLVQAAAGGVGSFAVQYCKHVLGMQVYATCSAHNAAFVRSIGADWVVDYSTHRFEDEVHGVDLVLDPMPYLYEQRTLSSGVLKKGVRVGLIRI